MTDRTWQVLWIAVALSLSTASARAAPPLDALLQDPEAAQSFDYCAWAHAPANAEGPLLDMDAALAAESNASRERRMAAVALVVGGVRVARATDSMADCHRVIKRGDKMFVVALRGAARPFKGQAGFDRAEDAGIAAEQAAITEHWMADQAARVTYVGLQTKQESGAAFWARQRSAAHATLVDEEGTVYLQGLLERYDWIDSKRFGSAVSQHAWLLVQHADDHPDFQALALERMPPYLESGGIKRSNYAFLWDRVAVNTGRKQRYGTQPVWECKDGKLELQPLEDPENVDARRAGMGMGTLADGLAEMTASFCR